MTDGSPDLSRRAQWMVGVGLALAVLALSVLTVLRYTVDFLQADGVQQSVMSVQDVDLFFWGQNRFAAFVSALASPIADPDANLFACLLINAVSFHVFLLLLAAMGTWLVSGTRSLAVTAVTFLALAVTTHLVIAPQALHVLSLESQPYSMSWALTLGAFLLWKSRRWWCWLVAIVLVGAAVGLNQSTILVAAFLAVIEMVRRRQWVRWPLYGLLWLGWFAVWGVLATRYGGNAGPVPDAPQDYFNFSKNIFLAEAPRSLAAVFSSFRVARLALLAIVAAAVFVALTAARRSAMVMRGAAAFVFVAIYWVVFTGNPWVQLNGYPLRYFFPTIMVVPVALAAPFAVILGALVTGSSELRGFRVPGSLRAAGVVLAVVVPILALGVALRGPLTSPSDAPVLADTRATADYARANGVRFISGYYWDMWPTLHRALDDGRHAAFVTAFKSGGDPAAYKQAFDDELKAGRTPKALCVNESDSFCETYLDYWTQKGWSATPVTCPVPGNVPQLGSPEKRSCRVMAYSGQ